MYEDAVTPAVIENITPYVSPESKNFQAVCHLEEPGERFKPGMFVKVTVWDGGKKLNDVARKTLETKTADINELDAVSTIKQTLSSTLNKAQVCR